MIGLLGTTGAFEMIIWLPANLFSLYIVLLMPRLNLIMRQIATFLLSSVLYISASAQNFEGKIIYSNVYKSKSQGVTDEQLTAMMGSEQEYYIKDGNYKSILNGTLLQWQLFINTENKLYTKMANSENAFWNDVTVGSEEVQKIEVNKEVLKVLGYKCDEVVLTTKSSVHRYYFNAAVNVDPRLFSSHKFGNWSDFISASNALPLKYNADLPQFTLESTATNVTPTKLDQQFFSLPTDMKIMKNPFQFKNQ